jgi:GH3 auxin-responsive promoter
MTAGVPFDATPLLRRYARHRLAQLGRQDAVAEQHQQLLRLAHRARNTRFGRDHEFAKIKLVRDFQHRVGLRRYEDMWAAYWQPEFPRLVDCTWPGTIPFFALSSGTTSGTSKYIPCSVAMTRANAWAAIDILVHHLANRPASRVLGGKSFMLGGSTDLTELSPGIHGGDLSGIAASRVPWWAQAYSFPPPDLALISDWEEKVEKLVRACQHEDVRVISGTPSWLVIFFERLLALHPEKPGSLHAVFPNLELLVHGGVNFAPYQHRFAGLLRGSQAELREVYPASEGFFAIADRGSDEGMRLIVDNGLFYEFVRPEELSRSAPKRCWLADAQAGVDYALVVSSCAGLWAYIVGDIIRFIDLHPPRLLVAGRLSYFLSAFGEHLAGEEIEAAVCKASDAIDANAAEFAVGSVFPDASESRGGHVYVVEFNPPPPDQEQIKKFAKVLDEQLCAANDDYGAHRSAGFGLRPPEVVAVRRGTFSGWMKQRGRLGGQNKVPRIINDQALFADLCRFAATRGAAE